MLTQLPIRLRNFFARYPPQHYSAAVTPPAELPPSPTPTETEPLPSPYTPNRDAKGYKHEDPKLSISRALLQSNSKHPNPFLPRKNYRTGKWQGPRFGLRQQAELVKLAIRYNVEGLLPPGTKSTEYKETRRAERGLQVKGTGVGQKVKGHKWERTMEGRLEDRRKAMTEMPELIRLWKQVRLIFIFISHFTTTTTIITTPFFQELITDCFTRIERSRSWVEEVAQEVNCSRLRWMSCIMYYLRFIFGSSVVQLAEGDFGLHKDTGFTIFVSVFARMYCTNRYLPDFHIRTCVQDTLLYLIQECDPYLNIFATRVYSIFNIE